LTNKKQLKQIFEFYNRALQKEWLFSNATMTKQKQLKQIFEFYNRAMEKE
jgi:hypothetical protein